MNQLKVHIGVHDIVTSITREFLHPENSNFVIIISTFIIIAVFLIFIQSLKSLKEMKLFRVKCTRASVLKKRATVKNSTTESDSIHESSLEHDTATNHSICFNEFYAAADKCYIEKYANGCRKFIEYYPHLINEKLETSGQTPFHRVCFHGHDSLIKLMLGKGADPNLLTNAEESPICLAIYSYVNEKNVGQFEALSCLYILQQAGCNTLGKTIWYDMFLKMAVSSGNEALTRWLLINRQYKFKNKFKKPIRLTSKMKKLPYYVIKILQKLKEDSDESE